MLPASRSTPSEEGVLAEAANQADQPNSQRIDFEPPDPLPPTTTVDRELEQIRVAKRLLRKEVIQPHLPVRLPCYDFTPIASPTFDGSLHKGWATGFGCCPLSWCDGRCVQGPGTYSPQHC